MRHVLSIAAFTVAAVALSQTSSAVELLTNGNFDGGPAGGAAPTGWTVNFPNGEVYADPGGSAVSAPNYMQGYNGGEVDQGTGVQIEANTTYTLSYYGRRFGFANPYDVRIYTTATNTSGPVGGVDYFSVLGPQTDTMTQVSGVYTPAAGDIGKFMEVHIAAPFGGTAGFDNISLISTLVPEPTSLGVLGIIGAAGLLRRGRRQA
jgi:hypothetical protein